MAGRGTTSVGPPESDDIVFPVVAIGASAGGLQAFRQFLEATPPNPGMAFVLIQHLDPHHESLMAELLERHTDMPVETATDAARLRPNAVFVIPQNSYLRIVDLTIHLETPVTQRGIRMPIDYCFRSLAESLQQRAVGIVLSGTASDGTAGLREIKAAGGLTLIQDPETAEHDGMPRSAIHAAAGDFVVPIAEMPGLLARYASHPYIVEPEPEAPLDDTESIAFQSVLNLLRKDTDHDFRNYRPATLNRRIRRRMGLLQLQTVQQYRERLGSDREEAERLAGDLLIGVTRFFRDPEAWHELANQVIEPMVWNLPDDGTVRVWVAGCSTGEEAVSAAILLDEAFVRAGRRGRFQIFATDIDPRAIEAARNASFPASIADDVSPDRLDRYFTEEKGRYVVRKRLRDSILFARQDLITDPPFSKLDLVMCRNVMIYLDQAIQGRILHMFHFSLRSGGHLFLGSAETVGKKGQMFHTVSKEWRLFRAVGTTPGERAHFPVSDLYARSSAPAPRESLSRGRDRDNSVDLAKNAMISRFVPATILVDEHSDAIYFQGPVREYLDFPSGEPTRDITLLALDGLRARLRSVIKKAFATREVQTDLAQRVRRNGIEVAVAVTAEPIPLQGERWAVLVYLTDADKSAGVVQPVIGDLPAESDLIQRLENDLQLARDELTSTVEELEASNEELRASNEEVMSMNEELQSSNEELETSREELQSLNEELSTVNNQLENKILELESANNDLTNLLNSTQLAVIFLDEKFRIRRFTPAAGALLRILDTDVGRPVSDLAVRFSDDALFEDAESALRTLSMYAAQVQNLENRWFDRRVLPYRTSDNRIEGVLVTYTDITELYQETQLRARREQQQRAIADLGRIGLRAGSIETMLEAVPGVLTQALDCPMAKVLRHRPGRHDLVAVAHQGFATADDGDIAVPDGRDSQAGFTLSSQAPVVVTDLATENRFSGPALLTDHHVKSGISVIIGPESAPWGVLGVHTTESLHFSDEDVAFVQSIANLLHAALTNDAIEQELRENAERLRLALEAGRIGTWVWDPATDEAVWDSRLYAMLGLKEEDLPQPLAEDFIRFVHEDDAKMVRDLLEDATARTESFRAEFRIRTQEGEERWVTSIGGFIKRSDGSIRLVGVSYDITELKLNARRLATLLSELDHRVQNMLTVMGSIVSLADKEEEVATFKANLRQRLLSLARTQSMLSHAQFRGASLHDRILDECAPYARNSADRVTFTGEDLQLRPQVAQTLGMAIHELITNAVKHGALSVEEGQVAVDATVEHDRTVITWRESEGPSVTQPTSLGFGTRIIKDLVEFELSAEVTMAFDPEGLVCRFILPKDAIEGPRS